MVIYSLQKHSLSGFCNQLILPMVALSFASMAIRHGEVERFADPEARWSSSHAMLDRAHSGLEGVCSRASDLRDTPARASMKLPAHILA
jgi:hypothetical protein